MKRGIVKKWMIVKKDGILHSDTDNFYGENILKSFPIFLNFQQFADRF